MKNIKVTTFWLNARKSAICVLRIADRNDILEYTSIKNRWVRLKGVGYEMEELIEVVEEEKSPRG